MDANRFLQDLAIHPYLDPYALLMRPPPPFTKVSEEGFSTKSSSQFGQGQNCISIKLLQVLFQWYFTTSRKDTKWIENRNTPNK